MSYIASRPCPICQTPTPHLGPHPVQLCEACASYKTKHYKDKWEHETDKTVYLEKRVRELKTELCKAKGIAKNEKENKAAN